MSLAALLLVPLLAGAAPRARVTPELSVGGGYASDLFVGAGFGSHGQLILVPGLLAELSASPAVKLGAGYNLTYARYGAAATGLVHDGDLGVRLRPAPSLELELRAGASRLAFSEPVAADPGQPASTSSWALQGGPVVRVRPNSALLLTAGYSLLRRESETGSGLVPEQAHTGSAGASLRLGPRVETSLGYDHVVSQSDPAELSYTGDGGSAGIAVAPAGELVLRARLGLHLNRFDGITPRTDRYLLLALSASQPLLDQLSLEAAWSHAENASDDPAFIGSRQRFYVGLRAELPWEP